jgi:hypothetical protein
VEVWGSYSISTSDSHSVKVSILPKSTPSLIVVSQQQSGSMGSYSSDTSDSHSVKVSIPPKSTPSLECSQSATEWKYGVIF